MNRRTFLRGVAATAIAIPLAPLVAMVRGERRVALDSVLRELYLPRLRERLGPTARWVAVDGAILDRVSGGYEAVLVVDREHDFVYGCLRIMDSVLNAESATLARALDREINGLARDMATYIAKGLVGFVGEDDPRWYS